jgi:hypothetical protein
MSFRGPKGPRDTAVILRGAGQRRELRGEPVRGLPAHAGVDVLVDGERDRRVRRAPRRAAHRADDGSKPLRLALRAGRLGEPSS